MKQPRSIDEPQTFLTGEELVVAGVLNGGLSWLEQFTDDPTKREWLDTQLRLIMKSRQQQMIAATRGLQSMNCTFSSASTHKVIFDRWWLEESSRVPLRRQFAEARRHLDSYGADVSDRTLHGWIKIGRVKGIFQIDGEDCRIVFKKKSESA